MQGKSPDLTANANQMLGPLFQQEPIRIIRGDGYIRVEPSIPNELTKALRYFHREFKQDPERPYQRIVKGEYRQLYSVDFHIDSKQQIINYLITLPGFLGVITNVLQRLGLQYNIIDQRTPAPPIDMFAAMRGLREYQYEPVMDLLAADGGIASCPTGFGKTHMIGAVIRAYKQEDWLARNTPLTVVAVSDKDVAAKNYRDLIEILPNREVGLVMSGTTRWSDDIQVITMDSLHRLKPELVGLFIGDEIHTAGTEGRSENIVGFNKARMYGFSASPEGRFDGGDLKTVGVFGPIVVNIPYSKGVEVGALVPITVYYVRAPEPMIGLQAYMGYKLQTTQRMHGGEANPLMNDLVAEITKRIPDKMQTLLIMQHQQQLDALKARLPDVVDVHASTSDTDLAAKKLRHLTPVSSKRRQQLYGEMERGVIRKAMATYVYKQGVNFPELQVMICPGGGGSKLVTQQVPGRASRRIDEKDVSYIVDFWHPWDVIDESMPGLVKKKDGPLLSDDKARDKIYAKLGFNRVWLDDYNDLPFLTPK